MLGPIEVRHDGRPVRLERRQQRILVGLLALEVNELVTAERLMDAVWPKVDVVKARPSLHTRISELRSALTTADPTGNTIDIESTGTSYRLRADRDIVDAHVFTSACRTWRDATTLRQARTELEAALALWHGPPLGGIDCATFSGTADALAATRLNAMEDLLAIDLYAGAHLRVVDQLADLSSANTARERLLALAMVAMYLSGRTAEALNLYATWRSRLRRQAGIDPGSGVEQIQQAILHDYGAQAVLGNSLVCEPFAHLLDNAEAATSLAGLRFAATPRTVPQPIADFTGRHDERTDLVRMLNNERFPLVAVSGPGGVGKTALAVAVAHLCRAQFPDGQLFVDLRDGSPHEPPAAPFDVLGRFLRALGVVGPLPVFLNERVDLYKSILADRRILVVLDNVSSDEQIAPLLPGSPTSRTLVTSRGRIGHSYGAATLDLSLMPDGDAGRLLETLVGVPRIRAEPTASANLVRLCGNLPLAIRIVGAKLAAKPHWMVTRVVEQLRDEHQRLAGLIHGELSVRASIAISYHDLTKSAQLLLQLIGRLGLPEVSAWQAAALLEREIPTAELLLEELFDAHLVDAARAAGDDRSRYKMHDLVRLFAWDLAEQEIPAEELIAAKARAYRAWLTVAEAVYDQVQGGNYQAVRGESARWHFDADALAPLLSQPQEWFDTEHRSIATIIAAAADDGYFDMAWELAFYASLLFRQGRYFDEWQKLAERLNSTLANTDNVRGQATVHFILGWIYSDRTDFVAADRHFELAKSRFETLGDDHAVATVDCYHGNLARHQNDLGTAMTRLIRANEVLAASSDRGGLAFAQRALGIAYLEQRELAKAADHLDQALAIYQEIDSKPGIAQAMFWIGNIHLEAGDPQAALHSFHASLQMARSISERVGEIQCLRGLGKTYGRLGDVATARAKLTEALRLARQPGPTQSEWMILQDLADLETTATPDRETS